MPHQDNKDNTCFSFIIYIIIFVIIISFIKYYINLNLDSDPYYVEPEFVYYYIDPSNNNKYMNI